MATTSRTFEGEPDLERLQSLAVCLWEERGTRAMCTPGDLAWWYYGPTGEDIETIRLWEDEATGDTLAWAWLTSPAEIDFLVHPRRPQLINDVLRWLSTEAVARRDSGAAVERMGVWTMDSDPALYALRARGFERTESCYVHSARSLIKGPVPSASPVEGYTIRPVVGEADVERRVEVHRAAFAPSRMTPEVYQRLMASDSYRELAVDVVAEAPDGSFASFCICWVDKRIGVAELEPVGTHPEHQRRGLARAVCQAALREALWRGARTAVVYHADDSDAAVGLYEGALGFKEVDRHRRFRSSLP